MYEATKNGRINQAYQHHWGMSLNKASESSPPRRHEAGSAQFHNHHTTRTKLSAFLFTVQVDITNILGYNIYTTESGTVTVTARRDVPRVVLASGELEDVLGYHSENGVEAGNGIALDGGAKEMM